MFGPLTMIQAKLRTKLVGTDVKVVVNEIPVSKG